MEFTVIDHSDEVLRAAENQIKAALEAVGQSCESHAKQNITEGIPRGGGSWYTPRGDLRNSVSHKVQSGEKAVYIGSNLSYAKFNELGTGKYGGGRSGFWVFVRGGGQRGSNTGKSYSFEQAKRIMAILRSKGLEAHMTDGMKPLHFLKNAAADHIEEYKEIIKQHLSR